ncbi:cytochrome c oxidase assembly protein COX18, mitochondrial isoform X2 [Rhynchophorus ferrugineus]|uniref:cytochrome c oxidase assembly protein COX18, mitochondrial isoform X2 n=1 Tax=Rhynchophorus ferrugineus TaxID=354439 RepID=UPI003FCE4CA5
MIKIIRRCRSLPLQHQDPRIFLVKTYENRYLGQQNSLLLNENSKRGYATDLRTVLKKQSGVFQKRHYSLQSQVELFVQTQTGLFKFLSESATVKWCQSFLINVHDMTGLPWWATIICSTIILRTVVTLPLAVYQQYILAKLENLKQELPYLVNELKKETAIAVKLYGWDERTARATYNRSLRKQWNNLIVRDNCHPFKSTILFWFQIPMWVSLSVSLRNLVYMLPNRDLQAQLTFTELSLGGFSFIPNLTIPDHSWILPVALGIINLLIIELQQLSRLQTSSPTKIQKYLTNTFRFISVLMIPFAAAVPSCLTLYWTTSSAYGLVQNLILMSPNIKRAFRIPKTAMEINDPYKTVLSNLKNRFKNVP